MMAKIMKIIRMLIFIMTKPKSALAALVTPKMLTTARIIISSMANIVGYTVEGNPAKLHM